MTQYKIGLILSGTVLLTGMVFAADAPATNAPATNVPPTNAPTLLPTMTIKGTNQPQSITSPSEADAEKIKTQDPGAFTLRSSSVLRRGRGANFEDLLNGIPGVITQSENEVEVSKISIRGSGVLSEDEPLGVNFLLDGFTFNQGDGEVILEDFDVGTLKYGEVYRGASAFKYGSLTLGGAVNMVSLTGYDADTFGFRIEGGSYGFVRGQASTGAVEGPVDFYASLSGRTRDGYRDHSYEDTQIFVSNLGYKISDTVENRFYLTADRTDRLLPGGLTKEEMYADPRQTDPDSPGPGTTPFAISQGYNKDWYYLRLADKISVKTDSIEADAGAFWWHRNIQEKGPDNDESNEGIQNFFADNIGFILNVTSYGELFGQRNIFTMGFTPNVEREVDSNFGNNNGQQGASTAHDQELSINAPLFAENQHYFTEKFSISTGIQASYAQRHFSDFYFASDQSANVVFRGISPKIGAIYELDDTNQIFANFSRGWQPPSFDNMVDFDDAPDVEFTRLAAQRAWTAEIGARGGWGPASWDLALYHSWVRDELLEINDAAGVDIGAENINRSYHQGIEAGLQLELLDWGREKRDRDYLDDSLKLAQTLTLNDLHFDHDPTYGNNRIAGIPIYLYEAELIYEMHSGFYAGPTVQCNITKYPADQENTLYADPYALFGFKMGYEFKKGCSVFVEARNLADKVYASSVDPIPSAQFAANGPYAIFHPGDGRSFYGGVSWTF